MPAVDVVNVTKRFDTTVALGACSLSLEAGRALCLVGPSGCGKTTLLRLVAGLERPDEGAIRLGERTVSGDGVFVPPVERDVGMVFQDFVLWPHMRVERHLDFVLKARRTGRTLRRRRTDALLSLVQLEDKRRAYPAELSGGQQQRVAIARALATNPSVLLLDEPFSNLDDDLREVVGREFRRLKEAGTAILLATHDPHDAEMLDCATRLMGH